MKRLINLFILQILTFVSFSQTRTTSGDAIRKEITPKYVNGVIKQLTIVQLKAQPISNGDSTTLYYVTDTGKKGYFELDKNDNSSIGNDSTIIVTNNGKRLKRTIEQYLAPSTTGKYYRGDKTWQDLNKSSVGLSNVDNTSDLNKPVSIAAQSIIDTKVSYSELTEGVSLGPYNPNTNSPSLTSIPNPSLKDGSFYEVSTTGQVSFSGMNFSSGSTLNVGDKLKKSGSAWYLIQSSNYQSSIKGIYSYNSSNTIDNSIVSAIKYIYLETKSTYSGNNISIRIIGYVPGTGLIAQLYNTNTSSVIYTVTLSNDTSKPSGQKRYIVHQPNEYYLDLFIDWSAISGNFAQSTLYSISIANNNYNTNRLAYQNFTNGIRSYSINGVDERISYAIKFLRFENATMQSNQWAVAQMGYDGVSAVYLRLRNTTTNTTYSYKLEDAVSKPSGVKRYFINNPYDSYIEFTVDWGAFAESNIISNTYTASIIVNDYDKNRGSFSQFSNGVNSFSVNGVDEKLALSIKDIYYEFTDNNAEFAISYLGYNGTSLVMSLRNLSTSTTYTYTLSSDTSKPSGVKSYQVNIPNESYLYVTINWDAFIAQGISSSTYTAKIKVLKYNTNRSNQLSSVDENQEIYRINNYNSFANGQIQLSSLPIEPGSLNSSGQDASNSNRYRTKYSIQVKPGSTVNYTIQANYTLLIQQCVTNGVKNYTFINDSGHLSGTGQINIDPKANSLRLIFRKLSSGVEVKISESEINNSNFTITTDYAISSDQNDYTKFTNNKIFNRFIREMYVEGLSKNIPYSISVLQRNNNGLYKLYIRNKNTNSDVFVWAPSAIEGPNENSILDITVSGIRVRAVLDWNALPSTYNNTSASVDLTDKIFNINYSPRISAYYSDKKTNSAKMLDNRSNSSVDKSSISNSVIPHKQYITSWMNSINAESIKNSTISIYDSIQYSKNGSVGILINQFVYEFCNEKDAEGYDSQSNVYVRKIDLNSKSMVSKIRIIGYGDQVLGENMTRIPYVFSGVKIGNIIRIYIRVSLAISGAKMGYIDYDTINNSYTSFSEINFNSQSFSYQNYYTYLKSNIGSELLTTQNPTSRDLTLSKHIMSYGGYYYAIVGMSVGVMPYSGANHTLIRSQDGISWTTVYTYNDRSGQDDGDMYIKGNILYAQLRQSFGSGFSIISAFNLDSQKEVAIHNLTSGTSRGEFFEYNNNLYLLLNTTDNRQFASLYKINYANEFLEISSSLSVEGWVSNWSIHPYNSKVYVFFGTQVWEFKIDEYNNSINNKLFDLLKN